jgi:hypothetical protein
MMGRHRQKRKEEHSRSESSPSVSKELVAFAKHAGWFHAVNTAAAGAAVAGNRQPVCHSTGLLRLTSHIVDGLLVFLYPQDYMAPEVLRCPPKNLPQENKNNTALHYNNSVDAVSDSRPAWLGIPSDS